MGGFFVWMWLMKPQNLTFVVTEAARFLVLMRTRRLHNLVIPRFKTVIDFEPVKISSDYKGGESAEENYVLKLSRQLEIGTCYRQSKLPISILFYAKFSLA